MGHIPARQLVIAILYRSCCSSSDSDRAAAAGLHGERFVAVLFARIDSEAMAALDAVDVLVPAHQRGGHRAGRDHKRLGLERAEQKRQHERDHDRLDRLADGVRGDGCDGGDTAWAGSFG